MIVWIISVRSDLASSLVDELVEEYLLINSIIYVLYVVYLFMLWFILIIWTLFGIRRKMQSRWIEGCFQFRSLKFWWSWIYFFFSRKYIHNPHTIRGAYIRPNSSDYDIMIKWTVELIHILKLAKKEIDYPNYTRSLEVLSQLTWDISFNTYPFKRGGARQPKM